MELDWQIMRQDDDSIAKGSLDWNPQGSRGRKTKEAKLTSIDCPGEN